MYNAHPQSSNSRNQLRRTQPLNPSPITPTVTRLAFPSPVDTIGPPHGRQNPMLNETETHISEHDDVYSVETPSYDTIEPVTPSDYESLDQLWDTLRQQKEARMAKEPPKVKSFEGMSNGPSTAHERAPEPLRSENMKRSQSRHTPNKKSLSAVTFRESSDGRSMMAFFNLPGLTKHDVRVSFQRNRLVVSWDEVQVTEQDSRSMVIQERREKTYNKIIPLPEGTKFEDIRAAMDGERLVLRYPNIDARPADTAPRSRSHHP